MTKITIFKDSNQKYRGFECFGHAEYDEYGKDIVCASISILVINTINSIDSLTDFPIEVEADEDQGLISSHFKVPASHDAELLLKSMELGLREIQTNYGNDYIILNFKEV